jgi:putative PIN family toxin of toxin-antitoxin system
VVRPRALFDTNLYINYLLSPDPAGSAVGFAIQAGSQRDFDLLLPDAVVAELGTVVARRAYLATRITQDKVDALLGQLSEFAIRLPVFEGEPPRVSRDPEDDYLLVLAVLHAADYIVTRDRDLLDLGHVADVHIVDPVTFLAMIRSTQQD